MLPSPIQIMMRTVKRPYIAAYATKAPTSPMLASEASNELAVLETSITL